MSHLIEFKLSDGETVLVEGMDEKQTSSGRNLVSRGGQNAEHITQAEKTLQEAMQTARSAAESVLDTFKEMNTPDEIQLQFGVKLAAQAGVIIASANSEVNFQVTLKWNKA